MITLITIAAFVLIRVIVTEPHVHKNDDGVFLWYTNPRGERKLVKIW